MGKALDDREVEYIHVNRIYFNINIARENIFEHSLVLFCSLQGPKKQEYTTANLPILVNRTEKQLTINEYLDLFFANDMKKKIKDLIVSLKKEKAGFDYKKWEEKINILRLK